MSTVPSEVPSATAHESGIECVMWISSSEKGPSSTVSSVGSSRGGRACGGARAGHIGAVVEQAVADEHRAHRGELLLGGLDERKPQAPGAMAEQVQRGLGGGWARGQEQRLVDVLQRGVDLGAALGLVDH